jgi:hypothetical protein
MKKQGIGFILAHSSTQITFVKFVVQVFFEERKEQHVHMTVSGMFGGRKEQHIMYIFSFVG